MFDALDRGARLAQVRQQERYAAAALGQLQSRVDTARNRLHIVFDTQQEAAHRLTALRFAKIQEGRRGGLVAAGNDGVRVLDRTLLVTVRKLQSDSGTTLWEILQILRAVKRLERVGCVELERAEEGLERESLMFYMVVEVVQKIVRILVKDATVVISLIQQVGEAFAGGDEPHGARLDLVLHIRVDSLMVSIEANAAVVVV